MEPKWLEWAKQIQSLAQQGLEYSKDKYDIERFGMLRDLSVEIMQAYTGLEETMIRDLFANESGYQTPKVDIRGAVIKDGRILLVRESIDGKWAIPGGWAEFNLSVKENVIKEIKEEAGITAEPIKLIAVQDRRYHNLGDCPYGIYKIFVLCRYIEGSFSKNIETEESGFFELDQLPELSLDRNTYSQIQMCFEAAQDQQWSTDFD